ncbi:tRNA pseudouridine(13) synthase TruD, partial [Candidatus Bathyarchaeota archaeon]|nr:tRNA pseudouridine(13) synthase TruD [Candidatus Bathyarchaeota archaeon]
MYVSKIDRKVGIEVYATKTPGISGIIKYFAEDFIVEEMLVNGSKASINHNEVLLQDLKNHRTLTDYLLCVLVKRDKDNFLAIKALAKGLGLRAEDIQIAGIKDTRAVTAQHITLRKVSVEDLQKVSINGIEVHPIGFFHTKISPYYLLGNQFRIIIRNIRHSRTTIKERISKTISELRKIGGIPNFFGHQRFGTRRPITHLVGKAIVKGNLEKAAMIFLAKAMPYENPESQIVRKQLWETGDFKQALKDFPKRLHYE